jgi:transcriptional regulator with PAS, ATPase and Fis domain
MTTGSGRAGNQSGDMGGSDAQPTNRARPLLRAVPRLDGIRPRVGTTREFGPITACSAAMHEVFDALDRFARTDVSLTFIGETGSGKDVLTRALHQQSPRARGPLVVFDCGAVATNLAESELLGHERGAFTGAVASHIGAFERAHGGTLFLDEIGELPLDLQPRLLRALESRRVRRVGGTQERNVDVRIVAATNRDLRKEVANGNFRADLFFRLAGAVVSVPPLRARLDDLPQLVRSLVAELGRPKMHVANDTFDVLRAHHWPGNVRELKNVLACAMTFVDVAAGVLKPKHFPLLKPADDDEGRLARLPLGGRTLEEIERVAIRQTMAETDWNKAIAARKLGIAISTLYEKLRKHDL